MIRDSTLGPGISPVKASSPLKNPRCRQAGVFRPRSALRNLPVEPLQRRFRALISDEIRAPGSARVLQRTASLRGRPQGFTLLELMAVVAVIALIWEGLEESALGGLPGACTCCDEGRFHSYRRDGERAGRLVHHLAAKDSGGLQPPARLDRRDSRT